MSEGPEWESIDHKLTRGPFYCGVLANDLVSLAHSLTPRCAIDLLVLGVVDLRRRRALPSKRRPVAGDGNRVEQTALRRSAWCIFIGTDGEHVRDSMPNPAKVPDWGKMTDQSREQFQVRRGRQFS
jgi:hypothetical protein